MGKVGQHAYLGGRDEGGVGVCFFMGFPAGNFSADDRLDTDVENLLLTETPSRDQQKDRQQTKQKQKETTTVRSE
jgi:hypothetical protein